jgi:hypothetical protein
MINFQKLFYLVITWSLLACSNSQSPLTKTFPDNYAIPYTVTNYNSRFSPTEEEILLAEQLLKEQLKSLNKDRINQSWDCPTIHKSLNKYARQYVGFLNEKGEKIIWINAVWQTKVPDYFNDEIVFVLDGCSYYWNVEVNLSTKKVSHLMINGIG